MQGVRHEAILQDVDFVKVICSTTEASDRLTCSTEEFRIPCQLLRFQLKPQPSVTEVVLMKSQRLGELHFSESEISRNDFDQLFISVLIVTKFDQKDRSQMIIPSNRVARLQNGFLPTWKSNLTLSWFEHVCDAFSIFATSNHLQQS